MQQIESEQTDAGRTRARQTTVRLVVVAGALLALTTAGCAQRSGAYSWGDRTYASYDECMAAKRAHQRRMTVAGAAGGAVTGALLGGNFGETALAAGVGAAGGALIAGSRRC